MTLALPYLELPDLVLLEPGKLGEGIPALSLKPFGVLVAAGVYLGALSAARYGARRGLQARALSWFIVHVVGCGFLFGHVLDVLLYAPERLAQDPWALFRVWDGLSSFGGFFGGAAGALWFGFRYRVGVLPYADVVASGLPLGWLFGRAGCALVHDHPGIASEAWFAVAYPGGGRLDLGLIELSLTLPIAIAFLLMQRRAWPWGFFLGGLCAAYAPVRFFLDFLRIRETVWLPDGEVLPDRRYAALTPAQWAALLLFGFGVWQLRRAIARSDQDASFAPPKAPRAFRRPRSDTDLERGGQDASDQR
ncbi:MAG TPA: prolipoprotein diacylglyceryl transferase family protein [Polyangiaceae bacterium]|nr:prolipoprotein diacylglyceryl transferase family protein [Polyangiaceae bacterium]